MGDNNNHLSEIRFPRKKMVNSTHAEKKFRSSILEASAYLDKEFQSNFLNAIVKDDIGNRCLDPSSDAASSVETIKKQFMFHLNASGKYLVLREHLKHAVTTIIQQKCIRIKSGGFKSRDEFQQFLHDLYLFLVDKMHETMKDSEFNEADRLLTHHHRKPRGHGCKKKKEGGKVGKGKAKTHLHFHHHRILTTRQKQRKLKLDQLLMFTQEAMAQGDFDNAHKIHLQRIAQSGESHNCWADFAAFWMARGDDRLAEIALRETLLKNPKNIKALIMSGLIAARHSDDRAITCLGAALQLIPNCPELLVLLGMAQSCLGNDFASQYFYKKARFIHHILTGRSVSHIEAEFAKKSRRFPRSLMEATVILDNDGDETDMIAKQSSVIRESSDGTNPDKSSSNVDFNEEEDGKEENLDVTPSLVNVTPSGLIPIDQEDRQDDTVNNGNPSSSSVQLLKQQYPDFNVSDLVKEIKSGVGFKLPSMGPCLIQIWNITRRSNEDRIKTQKSEEVVNVWSRKKRSSTSDTHQGLGLGETGEDGKYAGQLQEAAGEGEQKGRYEVLGEGGQKLRQEVAGEESQKSRNESLGEGGQKGKRKGSRKGGQKQRNEVTSKGRKQSLLEGVGEGGPRGKRGGPKKRNKVGGKGRQNSRIETAGEGQKIEILGEIPGEERRKSGGEVPGEGHKDQQEIPGEEEQKDGTNSQKGSAQTIDEQLGKIYTRRNGSELIWTAHVLLKLRLYDFLDGILARELTFNPKRSVQVLYLRSLSLHLRSRDGEAIGFLHEAIKKAPKNKALWALLGHCYYNLKIRNDTFESYERTLKLPYGKENLQLVYLRFGTLCLEKGLVTLAKKVFIRGLQMFPSPYMWLAMGNTCYHMKDYSQAETAFAEANRLENTNPTIWAHLSLVSLALGHQTLAEQSFKWAVRFGLKQGSRLMNELQQLHRETNKFGTPAIPRIPSCIPHQYYLQRLGKENLFDEYRTALNFGEPTSLENQEQDFECEKELIKKLEQQKQYSATVGKAAYEQVKLKQQDGTDSADAEAKEAGQEKDVHAFQAKGIKTPTTATSTNLKENWEKFWRKSDVKKSISPRKP